MRRDSLPLKTDKRVKLTKEDKLQVKKLYDSGWGIRKLSRYFEVDKRTIQFILFPERLERNKQLRRERLLCDPQRYYDKDTHNKSVADIRARKRSENLHLWKKECPICGKEFIAKSSTQIYCNKKCMWTAGNRRKRRATSND